MLFQRFDRLLLLSKGRTVYFGDVGKNSTTLIDYFTRNGGPPCQPGTNPAEYMLGAIGAAPGAKSGSIDWPAVWKSSPEYRQVQFQLDKLAATVDGQHGEDDPSAYREFAAPSKDQYLEVTKRVFQQYWRSPSYIYSKALLSVGATLFIGLSFINEENTLFGLRNQMFGVFTFLTIFPQVVDQILPVFVSQRTMYEARERPSKAYSWKAFMVANILVELAWNSLVGVASFFCWYYPIGLYRNAEWTNQVDSRGFTVFLHVWLFFLFCGTFANMVIAGIDSADVAGGVVNLFMIMMFAFCGVLATPEQLPGFWIFMYRVNPFTYVVEGFLGTSLANAPMHCEPSEFIDFNAPGGTTCGDYLAPYIARAGGYVEDAGASQCRFCPLAETNAYLSTINVSFSHRWRDFGFMWVYCIFNIAVAIFLYWLVRVPKKEGSRKSVNIPALVSKGKKTKGLLGLLDRAKGLVKGIRGKIF
ncbi:hypothetical protein CDD83_309 [Cordyceps sp. RAO-2017]|nr:hypothetical protein CDD83_309 [Cordyceps sp. RAO-2017]